jgi:hypothetical protein
MSKALRIAWAVSWSVAALLSPLIVRACVIVYPTVKVGRDFRARAMDRGHPVEGLRLVLTAMGSASSRPLEVESSITDRDGYARFYNLKEGSFFLAADHDGGVSDGVNIEVSPDGPTQVTTSLRWPSIQPIQVHSVDGLVRSVYLYPAQSQPELSLSLLEGVSGREIATTHTDSKGRFDFAAPVPPGMYFLRLNPSGLLASDGESIEGLIAFEVAPKAANKTLAIDIGWSDCGLGYAQRVAHSEMNLNQVCGDIADALGAAITNAQVMLLSDGEDAKVIQETRSIPKGQFSLPPTQNGTYQLLIRSLGFRPFLRVIHLDPVSGAPGECQHPIHVRLDVML